MPNDDGEAEPELAAASEIRRVSLSSNGQQGSGGSEFPVISADGRYVAFHSLADDLVPGDTNGESDVFIHDRHTGETERVSTSSDGEGADGHSAFPSVSADGRFVAFHSLASNLVDGDTNGKADVFVHDRESGDTERVSVSSEGDQAGRDSQVASISANGRYVAFQSTAVGLVPGDTNGDLDVFVHDRAAGETERVSVSSKGVEGDDRSERAFINADGRFVGFHSRAENLVPGDTNTDRDVFLRDRAIGKTERMSVSSGGSQGNDDSVYPSVSEGGRFVAFQSSASDLVDGDTNAKRDIFLRDRSEYKTRRLSVSDADEQANDLSGHPALTPDGRLVAFDSLASNLVPGDSNAESDVFVTSNPQSEDGATPTADPFIRFHADSEDYSGDANWDGPQDGAVGLTVGVQEVVADGSAVDLELGWFTADLTYDPSCVEILDVRNGRDFNVEDSGIHNDKGIVTFGGVSQEGDAPESILAFLVLRMVGSAEDDCSLSFALTYLVDVNEGAVAIADEPVVANVTRGDIRRDGEVTIADALFGAQYLADLRDGCVEVLSSAPEPPDCTDPVAMASVRQDGDFDEASIADVLFIAQMLADLRDERYALVE